MKKIEKQIINNMSKINTKYYLTNTNNILNAIIYWPGLQKPQLYR